MRFKFPEGKYFSTIIFIAEPSLAVIKVFISNLREDRFRDRVGGDRGLDLFFVFLAFFQSYGLGGPAASGVPDMVDLKLVPPDLAFPVDTHLALSMAPGHI